MAEQSFRILVVDDTDEVRELLRFTLRAGGYDCLLAADGRAGLELAGRSQPDLILLDLMMPGMDGYEVCRELKEAPATRRIPIIFLTARAQVVDRVRGLSLGAVDYVTKPFDPRELVARVDVALRTKQSIDSLERANSELHTSSVTDALTGLNNRRYFEARLAEELDNREREGVAAACLLLDLDHFKQVNDTYGHLGGDAVIRHFAEIIRQRTRKSDLAARFGGDEFAVLLSGVSPFGARAAAEKIRATVAEAAFRVDDRPLSMTTSIGIACFTLGGRLAVKTVIEQADRALYQAKVWRDRVEVTDE